MMSFLSGSIYRPSLHLRVSSATLKRAAQTPSGTPDLLCHPVREGMIYTSRLPTRGFEAAAPSGYRHLLFRPSAIAAGLLRAHTEDKHVQERFIVVGPVHRDDPTLSAAEARIQRYREPSRLRTSLAAVDGHDVCSALPYPLHSTPLAVAAFMTVETKLFSSTDSAGSSLRMLGYAAKAVYGGVAAVACYSFLEPQVRVECQVDSSAGQAALKRTWLSPLHRYSPPLTPRYHDTHVRC